MYSKIYSTLFFLLIISLGFGIRPPKNKPSPKEDILYSIYGGNVDSMLIGERRKDSLLHPYLYKNFIKETKNEETDMTSNFIYEKADVMPQFEGGESALKEFLSQQVNFVADTLVGQKADVLVKFYVNTFGDASEPKIIQTNNPAFDIQTLLIIGNMPKWIPGKQNGKDVNCYVTLPIKF
ncbi:MAG: energy transducer TonB [Chitinophagales bacterium]|nr:energy transducer TonB [Bacteroidota bacterium]